MWSVIWRKLGVKIGEVCGWGTYMIQTPPIATISESYNDTGTSGKEKPHFLQLVQSRKFDRMDSVPSDALGLKHFETRVRPYRYVSDIRRLTPTFWKDDSVMEGNLQDNAVRTGRLCTLSRRLLGCIGLEREGIDYKSLKPTKQRVP